MEKVRDCEKPHAAIQLARGVIRSIMATTIRSAEVDWPMGRPPRDDSGGFLSEKTEARKENMPNAACQEGGEREERKVKWRKDGQSSRPARRKQTTERGERKRNKSRAKRSQTREPNQQALSGLACEDAGEDQHDVKP